MTLDATIGGNSSNSYTTVIEADNYFLTSYNRPLWGSANNTTKETVLIESSRLLDLLIVWKGYIKSDTQSMKWPREFVPNINGSYNSSEYLDTTIIPKDIKIATYELAYSLLSANGFDNSENDLSSVKVGPIEVDFSNTVKSDGFPRFVKTLLQSYGDYNSESSNSIHIATLIRT